MRKREKLTVWIVAVNALLCILKLIVGFVSGSLAVISDGFNSFTDVASSIAIVIAVKVGQRKPDKGHPFGYDRAEPVAGLIVAIMVGVLAFEIAREAVMSLLKGSTMIAGLGALYVLLVNIAIKAFITNYYTAKGKEMNSPALKAIGIDARNDILTSTVAVIGVLGSLGGLFFFDSIAAIIISGFILYFGYRIGAENIDYLMGKTPPKHYLDKIRKTALGIEQVKGVNDIRAHYVGNMVHVEVHIEVGKNTSTKKSHAIGKQVQFALERFNHIGKAFIHIDPV